MKLTEEEKEICKRYSERDEKGKVHCSECPLVLHRRDCICKANISKKEWEENYA